MPGEPHLFRELCAPSTLAEAWKAVKAHYPSSDLPAGIADFDLNFNVHLETLSRDLREQKFLPEPGALLWIPKPAHPGEQRQIQLLQPRDRIVLTALNRILTPLFEPHFLPGSYAYRRGLGPKAACNDVSRFLRSGASWSACLDIDDFFPSIDRTVLLEMLKRVVWESSVYRLLETYLRMGAVSADLAWHDDGRGIGQGSPMSPLLSNFYLAGFDRLLQESGAFWLRFADNILLLHRDREPLAQCRENAEAFLAQQLHLRLNRQDPPVASVAQGFVFLGFLFQGSQRSISPDKMERMKSTLADACSPRGHPPAQVVAGICETVEGWRRHYAGMGVERQLQFLDDVLFDHLYRAARSWLRGGSDHLTAGQLKNALSSLKLPSSEDPQTIEQWVRDLVRRAEPETNAPARLTAAQAVARRRREVERVQFSLEEVVISHPGVSLGRSGDRIVVREEGRKLGEGPLAAVRHITILNTACSISGELMAEAAARQIPMEIVAHDGRPLVIIGAPEAPVFDATLAQARLAESPDGLRLAASFVQGKIRNQANVLKGFAKFHARQGPAFASAVGECLAEVLHLLSKLAVWNPGPDLDHSRGELFAFEGNAASAYWRAAKALLHTRADFDSRQRHGARDLVNSLLNYGYGILYARLLRILVAAGLNPNISFLHKPQPGKPTLLYDFIEEFRPGIVDRTVFAMLGRRCRLTVADDGLPWETRASLARAIVARLRRPVLYHCRKLSLEQAAMQQAQRLKAHILGEGEYQPYVQPW